MGKLWKKLLFVAPLVLGLMVAGCTEDSEDEDTTTGPDTDPYPTMVELYDSDINEGETLTLDADSTYVLMEFVFVEDGATLNIPAGTVIKGAPGGGLNASALIICRGATINATGTADNPIIMTSVSDDVDISDDLGPNARGLWGGLIVLGKSITQKADGEGQIEGIGTDPRGAYGGSDATDNSGTIQYVSIRYGGSNIGEGNEINGLTMGAVGSGTTIDHVEVYNNADDGFEWFGGTVNTKNLIAVGCKDDSYDWDEGFRGKGQYWVVVQGDDAGDRAAEMDGCASDNRGDTENFSQPTIYNATFIGCGSGSGIPGNMIFKFREETGGYYYNSIFTDFAGDIKYDANNAVSLVGVINFDDEKGTDGNLVSDHVVSGDLELSNNLFYDFAFGASTPEMLVKYSSFADADKAPVLDDVSSKNTFGDDAGVGRDGDGNVVLLPAAGSLALTASRKTPSDSFFDNAAYIGAFDAGSDWTSGWTFFSQL
ncbi:MAG: T9SS C-terminal target domain-containing protein [Chitinivibrionales bacterium]|nr:T9SS C-terminal target domain-containing protein [Chitinivibrionales bacterium]